MPLVKNASWKLVCHLNALFASQWKFKSSCTHVRHNKRLKNCLNRARKKLIKKLSSKRFSISVFIFENHCAVFFLVKISWRCYQLGSEKVYLFSYLFWDAKTGTVVFASIVVISPLQSIIQDQAAGVPSTGRSASDLKEKLRTVYKK